MVELNPEYWWGHYRRFLVLRELEWDREAREALARALSLSESPRLLKDAERYWDEQGDIHRRELVRDRREKATVSLAPRLAVERALGRGDLEGASRAWERVSEAQPALDSEPFQAPYQEWLSHVEYAYRADHVPLARRERLRERLRRGTRLTAALRDRARELVEGVQGPEARADRLLSWVRDTVDSAGGEGGLRGQASRVLAARKGNRTLLLSALLSALGLEHRVLVARRTTAPALVPPSPELSWYGTPVVVVGARYLAPSQDEAPAGWLPDELLGAEALVREDGTLRLVGLFSQPVAALLGGGVPPARYLQRTEREQPLMTRPLRDELTVKLAFPAGVELERQPKPVAERGAWGTLEQRWEAKGGLLTLTRSQQVGIVRIPPSAHGAFEASMAAADRAQKAELLLRLGGGEGGGAPPPPAGAP